MSLQDSSAVVSAARSVAWVSGAFTAVVAILLLATWVQLESSAPLDNPLLERLEGRLRSAPEDAELAEEVRALDLLARRAYLTRRWQLTAGGWLLAVGAAVLLGAIAVVRSTRQSQFSVPRRLQPQALWAAASTGRRRLITIGGVVLGVAVVFAVVARDPLGTGDDVAAAGPSRAQELANWPSFRGPDGNGIATAVDAPLDWDGPSGRGVAWRVEVPLAGYSSPVVWEDRIFLTGADRTHEEVYCFDVATGELRWRHQVDGIPDSPERGPRVHKDTGYAPSTVATDGQRVFAVFPTGKLVALSADGDRLWARGLGVPDNHYGHSSSLLLHEGLLLVQWDQHVDSQLMAFDGSSGEVVWRVPRSVISWSSPIRVHTGNRWELILTNSTSVDSFDPGTGVRLWGHDCLDGEMGPSAAFGDGWIFAVNDYATAVGIRLTETGAEVVWTNEEYLPDTASPVVVDGLVFLATSYGTLACLDGATGAVRWTHDYPMGFYASPVVVGDLVYCLDLDGTMHVVRASEVFEEVAKAALGEPAAATPAVVQGRIFLRGEKNLYCITGHEEAS